jgi:hypothetical protein
VKYLFHCEPAIGVVTCCAVFVGNDLGPGHSAHSLGFCLCCPAPQLPVEALRTHLVIAHEGQHVVAGTPPEIFLDVTLTRGQSSQDTATDTTHSSSLVSLVLSGVEQR